MMNSNYYFEMPKVCRTKTNETASNLQRTYRPKMNVQQNDEQITLEFSLVGVLKEDIKLNIKDKVLSLEAHRKLSQEEKNYQYREFGPVVFKTRLQLPENISDDSINAQFQNGVLKLSLKIAVKPNIQVEIK